MADSHDSNKSVTGSGGNSQSGNNNVMQTGDGTQSVTQNASVAMPDITNPVTMIAEAAKRVGVVWWFVAVGAVIAVLAIVGRWGVPPGAMVLGGVALVVGVVALVVTTAVVRIVNSPAVESLLSLPAMVLLWSFLILIILTGFLGFTSFFFDSPLPLKTRYFPSNSTTMPSPPNSGLIPSPQPRLFQVKAKNLIGPVVDARVTVSDPVLHANCTQRLSSVPGTFDFDIISSTKTVNVYIEANGYEDYQHNADPDSTPLRADLLERSFKPLVGVRNSKTSEYIDNAVIAIAQTPLIEDAKNHMYSNSFAQSQLTDPVELTVSAPQYKNITRKLPLSLLINPGQWVELDPLDPPVIVPMAKVPTHLLLFRDHFNGGTLWVVKSTDMSVGDISLDQFKTWCVPFNSADYANVGQQIEVAGDEHFKSGPNWWVAQYGLPGLNERWFQIMDDERWYVVEVTPR